MKHIEQRLIVLSVASALFGLLAACGAGSDDSAAPSSLPFAETTTSVADSPVTSESTPDEAGETEIVTPELTVEMFESMLETNSGRALMIGSIAAETNLEPEAAECLLDAIPLEMLVEAAGSFLGGGGDTDGGFFPADQAADIAPLLESCDIATDALLP